MSGVQAGAARPAMTQVPVAILGGGLAGLNAARLLHEAGIEVRLIEARDRLGGRILTLDPSGRPGPGGIDLGPSWFWPGMQPAIGALVAELGLSSFEQASDGDVLVERQPGSPPQRYPGLRQVPPSMRLEGGTGALVQALARRIPEDRLILDATVTALDLRDDCVALTTRATDGGTAHIEASQVIATVPPRILDHAVDFRPDLPPATRSLWRATPTWMAPHAKFVALYDRPFWRAAGLSGTAQSMAGPMTEIHDATTATGQAALFGFLGIEAAQRADLGEATLIAACCAQFARLFGPEAAIPDATFYKDWAADPLTATATDRDPAGHPSASAHWLDGPWAERLLLAGSETSPRDPGYLAGAVEASARAAANVMARLGTSPRTAAPRVK